MKYAFVGDSWATKAWTNDNYQSSVRPTDTRLATYWPWPYKLCITPGKGNLDLLDRILQLNLPADMPIVWIYTEPGRDYGRITNNDEFDWLRRDDIFELRKELDHYILKTIRQTLSNPIGLIGGLSDVDVETAESLGFTVLHPSWQRWIAEKLKSQWFKLGWGASDVGWRMHSNNIQPSKATTFAWDEQIKEWCWWEDQGYFSHEHPTPRANVEFADFIKPRVEKWLNEQQ